MRRNKRQSPKTRVIEFPLQRQQGQPTTIHSTKVLVTGATGKLGVYVCHALIAAGYSVRATDKCDRCRLPVKLDLTDLLDRDACYRLAVAADAIVHLANYSDMTIKDAQKLFNENVSMNMNVFQAAQDTGVKTIIFASTIQVLGGRDCLPYLPLDGDAPANPNNAYALSKLMGETMLQYFARTYINCIAIRFPWLVQSAKNKVHKYKNNDATRSDSVFSYLSFTDAANLIVAIVRTSLPGFRIYMPAHPDNRLGLAAADVIKRYYPTVFLRRPLKEITALIDISRIVAETGWRCGTAQD
jgi:nucleoside-diphosphate-sugar epimerase